MNEYILVVTSIETKDDAQKIAASVVDKRVAACAQVLGPIASTYWWKGKVETADEWLCVMKTQRALYPQLEAAIREIHPYEVPEIVATPIVAGSKSYLDWIDATLAGGNACESSGAV